MSRSAAVCLAVVLGLTVVAARQTALPKGDRELYKVMLREMLSDVQKNYYDPKLRGIDLAAAVAAASEKVAAASSNIEAIDTVTGVLFQFNDSHTRFYPPPRATRADYGWRMAAVGDEVRVVSVAARSDAATKGLEVGDRVLMLNRFEPTRANLWQISHYYNVVRLQAQQRVVVRKADGTERTLEIQSKVEERRVVQAIDLLDEMMDEIVAEADADRMVEPGILVWQMTQFRDQDAMRPFMNKARKAGALVIDLRGNPGGQIDGLKALVGMLFDREVLVMTRVGRKGEEREVAKPKGKPFTGKVVALIDSGSASSAECLARVLQLEKRGTVLGDRSAGALMASQVFPHTFGAGDFTFYATSVTVSDVRLSDGGRLEGVGVVPDEPILPTQADMVAGRDPVLARAIALLGGTVTPEQAGKLLPRRRP